MLLFTLMTDYQNGCAVASIKILSMKPVIGVYDTAVDVIETHEHKGEFKEW